MVATEIYEYNISDKIINAVKNQQEGLFYFVAPYTIAFTGYGNTIDRAVCKEKGVTIKDLPNQGGIIVSGYGSISVGHLSKNTKNTFNQQLTNYLKTWFESKGLKVVLEENDLLIDGIYKVASSGSRRFGDVLFSTFHISYTVDLDLIKAICTKPMKKIPKGLADYGIYSSELLKAFQEFVQGVDE